MNDRRRRFRPDVARRMLARVAGRSSGRPRPTHLAIVVPLPDSVAGDELEVQRRVAGLLGRCQHIDAAPHITLKLGFEIGETDTLSDFLTRLVRDTNPFAVSLGGVGAFEDGVAYLDVQPNPTLEQLRQAMLRELVERNGVRPEPIEDARFHFHVTLAHGLSAHELTAVRALLIDERRTWTFQVDRIELFRAVRDGWATLERFVLDGDRASTGDAEDGLATLRGRRQFVLSTQRIDWIPHARQFQIGGRYFLSAHPDLEVTQVAHDRRSLTLVGFVLDPDRPDLDHDDILSDALDALAGGTTLPDVIDRWGGRWVLFAEHLDGDDDVVVVTDATAQRGCYFARASWAGEFVCGSEPGLLARQMNVGMDPQAVDFIRSRPTDDFEVYWMPGDTTLYSEIGALLPNHVLSLGTRTVQRFWPTSPLPVVAYPVQLDECLHLLRGQMQSALRRFQVALPMTAGWDSRLMLALCRGVEPDPYAFTIAYPGASAGTTDVTVPARLLARLGIAHHVIAYPSEVDARFKRVFLDNNVSANTAYCADSQALHGTFPDGRICVTGDAAEVVKSYFQRTRPESEPLTGKELAEMTRLGSHPFVERAMTNWLDDVGDPPIEILDLFCWEQMGGRWQAKVRSEYDMVQESFAPLSNRQLLRTALCIDAGRRSAPDFEFFADLLRALWPEVLSEPINPPEPLSRSRRIAQRVGLEGMANLMPPQVKAKIKALVG
jgi:2'-5' RNA ligase